MSSSRTFLILTAAFSLLTAAPSGLAADTDADIEARIQKVGSINIGGGENGTASSTATSTAAAADSGSVDVAGLYQASCFACHGTGAAGAPKLGDSAAWSARIAKGEGTLVTNAIGGIGAMPAKGGANLSDDQVKAIVAYMIESSK